MTIYKKVRKLSVSEAAYLAGLIDGEGTVTLTKKSKNEERSITVTIANTEYQLLEYPKTVIGAGKITSKGVVSKKHRPSFTYHLGGRQALSLLEQINPFLRSYKKERAELALKDYVRLTPRNGRYSTELLKERREFIETFFKLKAK